MLKYRRLVLTFAAVTNLLLLDQIVKAAAVYFLKGHAPYVVLENFFNLAYVENRGCAWGLLQGQVWPLAVFAFFALGVISWKRKVIFPPGRWGAVSETLLYAGVIGNLIDRLSRKCVVDMFDFHWGVHHFPVFNVADSYITVAAAILIIGGYLVNQKAKAPPKDDARHVSA
ncbi:MAG: signal peptidase II [Kiritimatiellae bacterium]|nr:signal peptidase II [Kiritimatiellia bacterium]